ncbi:MAG: hypothetical protein P1U89_12130 [Verrucomicrobiales bacterium]|nr:hypothetical protein [Verrucomicrobiales bacterium]
MNRLFLTFSGFLAVFAILGCASVESTAGNDLAARGRVTLSEQDKAAIGRKIWQNECGGTVAGLTSWNQGEDFPSLGIGHFIWYVKGRPGPFDESFPRMIDYLVLNGVKVPAWIDNAPGSPWTSRSQFLAEKNSRQMNELRNLLANTVSHQTGFIVQRLENSLPKMMNATNQADRRRLESNFYKVAGTRAGVYALIDYVNFKGEGIKESESYNGQGWGLRDVLLEMGPISGPANYEFSEAAKRTLQRRVRNAPPSRGENRWLNGWMNRCEGYKKGV